MSGISSRKIYDQCYQSNRINQETASGTYKVNTSQINQAACIGANGVNNYRGFWFGLNEINNINVLSDVESHLKNIDIPDSRCLEGRTLIEKNNNALKLVGTFKNVSETCNRQLESSNTRLEVPVTDVKMMTQSRYDFPIIDPRAFVYMGITSEQSGSNRFGINSRLQAKDMSQAAYYSKIGR